MKHFTIYFEKLQEFVVSPPKVEITGQVNIRYLIYVEQPCSLAFLEDMLDYFLLKAGIVTSKTCNTIFSHDGSRVFVRKGEPRIEVYIETAYEESVTLNDINFYDEEIVYPNCTVQILRNSVTGKESVGWRRNDENSTIRPV